jgi:peptidoglycan/LPS O-acetylase OafA/YrhL
MTTTHAPRVETIDVFRGIAILLVVLYHFTARLPPAALNVSGMPVPPVFFGWAGVYFFFAISGYCIFLTLERSATVSLFLARRFSRLYPAFLAAAIFLFVYGLVAPPPSVPEAQFHEQPSTVLDLLTNLVFLGDGRWVNGSFWSIAVEIKFYVGLGLLALMIPDRQRLAVVFSWISLAAPMFWMVGMVYAMQTGRHLPVKLLELATIAPYLPFFAIGILARMNQPVLLALCFVEAGIVMAMMTLENDASLIGGAFTTLLTLGFLAALVAFAKGVPIPHVPGLSRTLASVGLVSFSWYLVHENLGASFLFNLNRYMPNTLAVAITVGMTLLIGWVFSELVEWRFRKPVETLALRVLNAIGELFTRLRRRPGAAAKA